MSPFFYMEAKFGPLEKGNKKMDINRDCICFLEQPFAPRFGHKRKEEVLEELKLEPADQKLRRYKLAATCNKNGQQQDGKNSVELQTRWTKTT